MAARGSAAPHPLWPGWAARRRLAGSLAARAVQFGAEAVEASGFRCMARCFPPSRDLELASAGSAARCAARSLRESSAQRAGNRLARCRAGPVFEHSGRWLLGPAGLGPQDPDPAPAGLHQQDSTSRTPPAGLHQQDFTSRTRPVEPAQLSRPDLVRTPPSTAGARFGPSGFPRRGDLARSRGPPARGSRRRAPLRTEQRRQNGQVSEVTVAAPTLRVRACGAETALTRVAPRLL